MLHMLVNLLLAAGVYATETPLSFQDADLRDLGLLPLDKLLAIKRAISYKDIESPEAPGNQSSTPGTQAQALRGDPGDRRTLPPVREPPIWVEEVDTWKGEGSYGGKGKGALQGIFQGTVTVLAFLAFGGYLICLILNAIKAKKAALEMTLLTTVAPAARRRRTPELQKDSVDRGYAVLRSLAEAYAKYNQRCLH